MKKIAIIGAGPAGLMTAASLLEGETGIMYEIHIFEKNPSPGKKLLISGGGRCNITTAITDKKILATKYTRGWEFIKKSIGTFSPKKCADWFESHGISLKSEADNRVFPVSDDGSEVLEVFENIFAKYRNRIQLCYNHSVFSLSKDDSRYIIESDKGRESYESVVIATGGNAYSHTGSTGDGYAFVRGLGHTVTRLGPSLSSFLTDEHAYHTLSGLSLPYARCGELVGPLLFTHFGLSGPLAFMISSKYAWDAIEKNKPKILLFAPIRDHDAGIWETYLREAFLLSPKKYLSSILDAKLPKRFIEVYIETHMSHLKTVYAGSINRKDREQIASHLGDGIPLTLIGRRPGDEFVTAGGVDTDEIDPDTMESKIHKNLYFAGEILNVDGYTGGFSLQICWSSGYVAGQSISRGLFE